MAKTKLKTSYFLILILIVGAVLLLYIDQAIKNQNLKERETRLRTMHNIAKTEVEQGLHKFAALVSGVKTKIYQSEEIPPVEELQAFVSNQIDHLVGIDSIAASFVDKDHVFQFAFTKDKLDPYEISGIPLKRLRPNYKVEMMDSLMMSGKFFSLFPINVVEGWVAIPLDFGVIKNGEAMGYMAMLTDFKSVVEELYTKDIMDEFVFHFTTSNSIDLNRERVFDETPVYNNNEDAEYFRNFQVDSTSFIYSDIDFYGLDFRMGTAFKKPYQRNDYVSILLLGWFLTLVIFSWVTLRQLSNLKASGRHITEQKKEMADLMDTKNKLFSIVAHDLRSPLATIIGLTDLLKEEEFKDPEIRDVVTELEHSSRNTLNLLDNLLKWSKVQTGDLNFNPEEVDLKELIEKATAIFGSAMKNKELTLVSPAESAFAKVDTNMISTVIRNLLNNAIKFSPKRSTITIGLEKKSNVIQIMLKDEGVGIPKQEQAQLFNPSNATTTSGTNGERGTGLGLLLCKEFVEVHQGKIWFDSKEGEGTTFYFTVPS